MNKKGNVPFFLDQIFIEAAAMHKNILCLILLFSVSLNAFPGQINIKKLHKEKWIEVFSENFAVITNAKEKNAHAMARELEQFRYFMAFLLGYKQRELGGKIPVFLAKNQATHTAFGIPPEYGGIFVRQDGLPLIFANSKGFSESTSFGRQIVFHELTHLLMNNASIGLANPPWYSEGIAEYFGTYVEKKGQILLGNMSLLENRFYSLIKPGGVGYENIDTESLFKTTELEIEIKNKREQKEKEKFYARAFSVVHYMNADPERRKMLFKYLYLINKGHSVDASFKAAFQMTFVDLDKAVNQYIISKFVYARVFNIGPGGVEYPEVHFSARVLDQKEAMRRLVPGIAMLGNGSLVEAESVEAMYKDVETIYPDFFTPSSSAP